MKYLKQLLIILLFSFLGELCNYFLPLPIPASIYGIVFLLLSLNFNIIRLDQIKETGKFLVEIMPIMFIPAAIGLIDLWPVLQNNLIAYLVIVITSTVLVMGVAGKVCEWVVNKQ